MVIHLWLTNLKIAVNETDLHEADLEGANLEGATLKLATYGKLEYDKLRYDRSRYTNVEASSTDDTVFPKGFDPIRAGMIHSKETQ